MIVVVVVCVLISIMAVIGAVYIFLEIDNFLIEVPKQLRRIADKGEVKHGEDTVD